MKPVESKIQLYLERYRCWAKAFSFRSCVLVQYSGPEIVGSIEVERAQIETQIEGCAAEGFDVFWNHKAETVFLCVTENWHKPIPWEKVFEKADFIHTKA